jgi:hypothetical protein
MKMIWSVLLTTVTVLIAIFILNRVPFTRDLVQAAIK